MGKKALLSDHAYMISRNGAKKAVPFWQVKDWIARGIFDLDKPKGNEVGYDFEAQSDGEKDYAAWLAEQKRLQMKKASQRGPIRRDEGIAGAAFNLDPGAPANTDAFTQVPASVPGSESIGEDEPKIKPKDFI